MDITHKIPIWAFFGTIVALDLRKLRYNGHMNEITLRFGHLCNVFLSLTTHAERVACLKEMRSLVRTGEVA